jgi:hypothetical protein
MGLEMARSDESGLKDKAENLAAADLGDHLVPRFSESFNDAA